MNWPLIHAYLALTRETLVVAVLIALMVVLAEGGTIDVRIG